jgi:hypothetical protein
MHGNTRGADGVWDRGAYEYSTTGVSWQLAEGSWQAPSLPNQLNNCQLQTANCQLYTLTGVLVTDKLKSGVYLVADDNSIFKVVKLK